MTRPPLADRRVVLTRPTNGALGDVLAAAGADVVYVPLIAIGPPADGGTELRRCLDELGMYDWLVVTSVNGAAAVGEAAGAHVALQLAAVGTASATSLSRLAHRPVDLVPRRQRVEGLLEEFPPGSARVLVAQANRAGPGLADGLRALGCGVTAVEAYRTLLRPPDEHQAEVMATADAVVLASGSTVEAWLRTEQDVKAIAAAIVTIGPETAKVAEARGLRVVAVADTPSDTDVLAAVCAALS